MSQLGPFNPKNPMKQYGKPKQKGQFTKPDVYGIDDYDTTNMSETKKQIIKTETKLGNLNPDSPDFKERAKVLIDEDLEELKNKLDDLDLRTDKYPQAAWLMIKPNLSEKLVKKILDVSDEEVEKILKMSSEEQSDVHQLV